MRRNFESEMVTGALWLFSCCSLLLLGRYCYAGAATWEVFTAHISGLPLALTFRLDSLSALLLPMVAVLSAIVSQYSVRYLDGEKQQSRFHLHLLLTVTSVFFLILSSNLLMFFIAWLGISFGLHKLLLFYPNRPAAVIAARKKFLVSRLGDVMLLTAFALLYKVFGTFSFDEIFAKASLATEMRSVTHEIYLQVAAVLIAAGAMTKSVQFPFHFWLPETMETPTPVSALMHAGIINAGGFLVLRLSPIMSQSELASSLLAIVGAFTAVYGALVMGTQNSIKSKLAYSTVSQMGMMMFACGIGAYTLAVFHILAHSFYKAYAFLSTGMLVEEKKRVSLTLVPQSTAQSLATVGFAAAAVLFSYFWNSGAYFVETTYVSVLMLGFFQCSSRVEGTSSRMVGKLFFQIGGLVLGGLSLYVAIERSLENFLSLPTNVSTHTFAIVCAFAIFAAGFFASRELMNGKGALARSLYMLIWNDSFFGLRTTRFLNKFWPV